jgi:hypothetical protein
MIAAREIRHKSVTIRHNSVTDSAAMRSKMPNPSQSVTGLSQGFVTDFGGVSIERIRTSLSPLQIRHKVTRTRRKRGFFARAGACDGFPCDGFRAGHFRPPRTGPGPRQTPTCTICASQVRRPPPIAATDAPHVSHHVGVRRDATRQRGNDPAFAHHATRGHTVAQGAGAKVAGQEATSRPLVGTSPPGPLPRGVREQRRNRPQFVSLGENS